jgi:AcrR family transcriptional regulator
MDAGEALIGEKGFVRATVDEISQRAGVTSDVFYGHFAGKGALLRALNERFCDQAMTVTDQATKSGIWTNATARDVVEVAVRSILDVVIDRQGLVRAVLAHGTTDPALPD